MLVCILLNMQADGCSMVFNNRYSYYKWYIFKLFISCFNTILSFQLSYVRTYHSKLAKIKQDMSSIEDRVGRLQVNIMLVDGQSNQLVLRVNLGDGDTYCNTFTVAFSRVFKTKAITHIWLSHWWLPDVSKSLMVLVYFSLLKEVTQVLPTYHGSSKVK